MIDPLAEIEDLVEFEGRLPGSDAERRAANHLRRRLEALGRGARIESTSVLPNWTIAHALNATLAVVGSAVAVAVPLAGAIVVAVATVAALGEMTGAFRLIGRLTGRRASQNVISEERSPKPGTLVLTAHCDTGKSGLWYSVTSRLAPYPVLLGALLVVLACTILRTAGVEGTIVSIAQFVPTVLLILAVPLFLDHALSGAVPGANDNASGAATVLRLAERYGGDLEHFDLWVLFTGAAEAGQQGMRAWLGRHRRDLDPVRTVVVNLDEVGAGTIRYATREGPLLEYRYHPQLIALCDQLREEGRYAAEPARRRGSSDAQVARGARLPAISISCAPAPDHHRPTDTPEAIDEDALDHTFEFCAELLELIDERVGPELPERASEAFSSA